MRILGFLVLAAVAIFEADDVVQFGRRHLEDVAVFDRRHPVHGFRRDVHALAGAHLAFDELTVLLNLEQQLAGVQVDRLVLQVVVLQAERVPFVHVNQLADVALGLRPVELVAPGLLDARYLQAHDVTPLFARWPSAAASSRSMSSTVARRSTRRASARSSSTRCSESTCLATPIAPGVMLNSARPRPTSSVSSAGSDAISPHSDSGIRRRRAARATIRTIRRIAGCSGSYSRDTRSSARSTASVY